MPSPALLQAGAGILQTGIGALSSFFNQRKLENLKSPKYNQNQSILDYYNQALARYNVSPTDSALYKRSMRAVDRNTATGLNYLQDRRAGLAGASSVVRAANDASLDAEARAEQERTNRFGQLGGATEMKAGEDRLAYQYNEREPFERKYNLLAMKAGGANQTANAGLSNIFGGLQNMSNMDMLKQMYGGDGAGKGGFWNSQVSKLYRK